jgi:poly(ADP-ribose) glycohydrolase ARH3
MTTRERIRGLFLGTALGDALGMPVETWDRARIQQEHGLITNYVSTAGHKWFDGVPRGSWTDDTQLTLAIARAILDTGTLDLDAIAACHVEAFRQTTRGWGDTTRDSVANLANGISWRNSATGAGTGNGVCMKIAPVGAYLAVKRLEIAQVVEDIARIAMMTHRTSLAVSSGLAHAAAIRDVLLADVKTFLPAHFIETVVEASSKGRSYVCDTLGQDDLTDRLSCLRGTLNAEEDGIIARFGGGSYYAFHSLPFTYAFFLGNPHSIESLYRVVSAGGDTDSNGSMLGGLLGALHGTAIFPQYLIDGLVGKDEILSLAEQFCERLAVS